jgi:hypothetical protein
VPGGSVLKKHDFNGTFLGAVAMGKKGISPPLPSIMASLNNSTEEIQEMTLGDTIRKCRRRCRN